MGKGSNLLLCMEWLHLHDLKTDRCRGTWDFTLGIKGAMGLGLKGGGLLQGKDHHMYMHNYSIEHVCYCCKLPIIIEMIT